MKQRDLSLKYMPNTQSLLADQSVEFTKAYVTRSLCCPSRASTLRGQYTHNHHVWTNVPPSGGFWSFYDQGLESSTIATWLDNDPGFVDGRSLKPLLNTSLPASWRTAFLVEHRRTPEEFAYVRAIPNYSAVRTARYNYVEYGTGERELYDLDADPTELTSLHASASPALLSSLKARLDALKICTRADASATSCKVAEDGG